MSTLVSSCINDLIKLSVSIKTKEQEIEKRREVITKFKESETTRKKNESKKEKLTSKELSEKSSLETKVDYYQKEIKMADEKREVAVRAAEEKRDLAIKAAEDKFEQYRAYCLSQIALSESKAETKLQTIETDKNTLEDIGSDDDSDKVLIRLKKELEQINENIADKTMRLNQYQAQAQRNREEEQRMQKLIEHNSKRMQEIAHAEERRNISYTNSFYEKEEKEEPYINSFVPTVSPEVNELMDQRKKNRIAFKNSSIFSGLTSKQQQHYRELDYEDQDKIYECKTLQDVKNLLKEMKEGN